MNASEYKAFIEARVANNNGSSAAEVVAVSIVLVSTAALAGVVGAQWSPGYYWWRCFSEILVLVAPLFAAVSLQLWSHLMLYSASFAVAAGLVLFLRKEWSRIKKQNVHGRPRNFDGSTTVHDPSVVVNSGRRTDFTLFRGSLMLLTCFCILCVDFDLFDRQHMKTETYGVSLMDTGVGSFVFSAGCAAAAKSRKVGLWASTVSSIPLFLLGGVRLYMVWATDYQEHVSEYGTHWNFFFTLAVLPFYHYAAELPAMIRFSHHTITRTAWFRCVLVTSTYQFCLSVAGLTEVLQSNERTTLLEANKEGIFSAFGYVGIFLGGVQVGKQLFSPNLGRRTILNFIAAALAIWTAAWCSHYFIQPTSRRFCNMSYVFFSIAFNLSCLLLFMVSAHGPPSLVLQAVNYHSLSAFMVANVATGAVNVSMRTVFVSRSTSVAVVSSYMVLVCGVACVLHRNRGHVDRPSLQESCSGFTHEEKDLTVLQKNLSKGRDKRS